jgi:hypothetical protein
MDNIDYEEEQPGRRRQIAHSVKKLLDTSAASEFAVPLKKLVGTDSPERGLDLEN